MTKKYVYVVTEMKVRRSDSSHWRTVILGVYSSEERAIEVMTKAADEKKEELDRNLKGTRFENDVEMTKWGSEKEIVVAETYGGDADSFTYAVDGAYCVDD